MRQLRTPSIRRRHPDDVLVWVVGAGGLLGAALVRQFSGPLGNGHDIHLPGSLPWGDERALARALGEEAQRFQAAAGSEPWAVVWAAGQASTSSSDAQALGELRALELLIASIEQHRPIGHGAFFLSSSAGGVYAGSMNPPFTSHTAPAPLSAYGRLKLAQEELVTRRLGDHMAVIVGRFSNLYGPGQDLAKLQGLVSRLALAAVTREPVSMFVSLDTLRDYLFVDDAAAIASLHLEAALDAPYGSRIVVIASGQPTPLGRIIHTVEDVARVRIPIAYGSHASASAQALDLRLQPSDSNTTARYVVTTLPAGVRRVLDDIAARHQAAAVASR